jgi:hypothetical protein
VLRGYLDGSAFLRGEPVQVKTTAGIRSAQRTEDNMTNETRGATVWAHLRSNAIAYLALIVALGGSTAYAATELLPKGSVGAKQIRKSAVSAKKLKANAVTSAKVADRTLLAEDFAPGVLGVAGPGTGASGGDGAAGAQGEPGPVGPQGEIGPKGEPGPAGEQGPVGPAGERGMAGPQGERGPAGPTGERGPAGAQGERGPTGPQGIQGAPGLSGYETVYTTINGSGEFHAGDVECPTGKKVLGGGVFNNPAGGSADLEIHYSYPVRNGWTARVKFEDGRSWTTQIFAICAYVQ